jgi:predicted aldo/keto reductase-like oxidoreductase
MRVSEIGLGGSYLVGQSRETVVTTTRRAIACGVNYFDLFYSFPDYLANLGEAFKDNYADIHLALHLGSSYDGNRYSKTRDPQKCELLFNEALHALGTDHADVLHISYVDWHEWSTVVASGGVLDLARNLRKEGKAKHIGMSTHSFEVAKRALGIPEIEVLMLPLNLTQCTMPGIDQILGQIQRMNLGLVAMKPFCGGRLLQKDRIYRMLRAWPSQRIPNKEEIPETIRPEQCLDYVLSMPMISTTIPGVKNVVELEDLLNYSNLTEEERNYRNLLNFFRFYGIGNCVYCGQCEPCPVGIDVTIVNKLLDAAEAGLTPELQEEYDKLKVKPSACVSCFKCAERCPYFVDVFERMQKASSLFDLTH